MKKKILSLVLALLMVGSSASMVAADDATTTAAENTYEATVEFLHSYGIYKGDGASLAIDEEIERYEMALFVARISTGWVDDEAWEDGTYNSSGFTDIEDGEEASKFLGAISYASQKGIIEGYGNGEFGPYDGITYQDALTMLVRTLGYTGLSYPWGNIEKAVELKLVEGITGVAYTDILTRGEVARLIYNALFATKNGGSTLALDVFGMSSWTPIIITASDIDIFEQGGAYVNNVAGNYWVSFKIFDPATGYIAEATKDTTYYVDASELGLDFSKHEDDLAVGSTYYVIFKQTNNSNYVDIVEYQSNYVGTLWNTGKNGSYDVDNYFGGVTVVTKYTPANFLSNTKFTKPEIMLYDELDNYISKPITGVDYSGAAIDMATGDILVKQADGTYKVEWYWNAAISKYLKYTVVDGKLGVQLMQEGDFNFADYIGYKYGDAYNDGTKQLTAAVGNTAYASLDLEDTNLDGVADRAFYESYQLGYYTAGSMQNVTDGMVNSGNDIGLGASSATGTALSGNALAAGYWSAEGYAPTKNGYAIYNYDAQTKELKVIKEIADSYTEGADSYVSYGVLRAYSTTQGVAVIGDQKYAFDYSNLKGGMKNNAAAAVALDSMLNHYVKFVILDGSLVAINLVNDGAQGTYLIVKEYAGMTNDGYIAVEAYNAANGALGIYAIASYNGWKQGDYYYYLTEEKARDAFSTGAMYYVKSYDKNEDAYNVDLVGYFSDKDYVIDSGKASLTTTTINFYTDGYRTVNGALSYMSATDTYIILPKAGTDENIAPIYVFQGIATHKEDWSITGDALAAGGSAIVLVNATFTNNCFVNDAYQSGMYLYEGGKVIEAAYDEYYNSIFGSGISSIVTDRYILGATVYRVEALNLYTGNRETVLVDRNIDLVKGHIYRTISGKFIDEVDLPTEDNEEFVTGASDAKTLVDLLKKYYTDNDLLTADYLIGTLTIASANDVSADAIETAVYGIDRNRITAAPKVLFPTFSGNTMAIDGTYAGTKAYFEANPNVTALDVVYIYNVKANTTLVYATTKAATKGTFTDVAVTLKSDVNGVAGVNLKMYVSGTWVADKDGTTTSATINTVKFVYEGADNMRHNDRAAAGLGFGHLSQHALGSYYKNGDGLKVNDVLVFDLYKNANNGAVKFTTWACADDMCDIVNSIEFTGLNIAVASATDTKIDLVLNVTPAIKPEEDAAAGEGTTEALTAVTPATGAIGGTIINGVEEGALWMGDGMFDGDVTTSGSVYKETDFTNGTANWAGIQTANPVVPTSFVIAVRSLTEIEHFVAGSKIQGSTDGTTWTDLVDLSEETDNGTGWEANATGQAVKTFTVTTEVAYTYFRIVRISNTDLNLNEFQLFGTEQQPSEGEGEGEGSGSQGGAVVVQPSEPIIETTATAWALSATAALGSKTVALTAAAEQVINAYPFLAWTPDSVQ